MANGPMSRAVFPCTEPIEPPSAHPARTDQGPPRMNFPPIARVRQSIPQPQVKDVPGTVRRLILESRLRERVPKGGTVAVGVGSRGITAIPTVAHAAVNALKEMGYRPFIVAAMG